MALPVVPGSGIPWKVLGSMLGLSASSAAVTWALQSMRGKDSAREDALVTAAGSLGALAAWEAAWWLRRRMRRASVYQAASTAAHLLGRPLVVIGAPDGGVTSGYGCGDVTIDLSPSVCPNWKPLDITKPLPFPDASVVVFCSCVLEYVDDPCAALSEIRRVSGGEAYFVGVEPWTLTALYFPGAKQTLPAAYR